MSMEFEGAQATGMVLTRGDLDWLLEAITKKKLEEPLEDAEDGEFHANLRKGDGEVSHDSRSFGAGNPWPGGLVKYCWDSRLQPSARRALECAMRQVRNAAPGIRFVNSGRSGSSCADGGILMQSSARGCFADLGKSSLPFGSQRVNLQVPGCDNCGTGVHEILHAMGMAHEQSRPDRDRHVMIFWQNIRSGMAGQFSMKGGADTSQPYDTGSIMHYGPRSFSKNGQPTIMAKRSFSRSFGGSSTGDLGQRTRMSRADIGQLRALYGCQPPSYRVCDPPAGGPNLLIIAGAAGGVLALGGVAYFLFAGRGKSGYSGSLQRLH